MDDSLRSISDLECYARVFSCQGMRDKKNNTTKDELEDVLE